MDELYMEYDDLVEAGEIDPNEISIEDWVADRVSTAIDRAHDSMDMER